LLQFLATYIHLASTANTNNSSPNYRDRDGELLHNYWAKLLLIIRPVSMAAAAAEKAAAAAAIQKARDKAAAEARAKSRAAAAAANPELEAALAELQHKKAEMESAQLRVNALKEKIHRI